MHQHTYRCASLGLILGAVVLAAFFAPGAVQAQDPVDRLREALRIDPSSIRIKPDPSIVAKHEGMIQSAIDELEKSKSITQLRRAYFLPEWSDYQFWLLLNAGMGKKDKDDKKAPPIDQHVKLGNLLESALKSAAVDPSADKRLALALLLAEMEAAPQVGNVTPKEKFARRLTQAVCILAKDQQNLAIRHAGLHALGRITPVAAQAFPVLADVVQKDVEIGPRRLAAHALSDLAGNARALDAAERLSTIEMVVSTAVLGLRKNDDEEVRGYCLQAIEQSARALLDYILEYPTLEEKGKRKLVADLKPVLDAYQSANADLVGTLAAAQPKLRLASLQTLDHVSVVRLKILRLLGEVAPGTERTQLFDEFKTPDPLAEKAPGQKDSSTRLVEAVGSLLAPTGDVRQRRGAIAVLEMLRESAEPAAAAITRALQDPDRFVRWTAARSVRNLSAKSFANQTPVDALAGMAADADPDLSRAAAEALETIGFAAQDAGKILGRVVANAAEDYRRWDVETRVAAMKALVSIRGKAAQDAMPDILAALADDDVRVRRKAAETLGRLGRPAGDEKLADRVIAGLTAALGDETDSEVRLNISEAILSVGRKKGL